MVQVGKVAGGSVDAAHDSDSTLRACRNGGGVGVIRSIYNRQALRDENLIVTAATSFRLRREIVYASTILHPNSFHVPVLRDMWRTVCRIADMGRIVTPQLLIAESSPTARDSVLQLCSNTDAIGSITETDFWDAISAVQDQNIRWPATWFETRYKGASDSAALFAEWWRRVYSRGPVRSGPWPVDAGWIATIDRFAESGLSWADMWDAVCVTEVQVRAQKLPNESAWRYFCGVCWNKVRSNRAVTL